MVFTLPAVTSPDTVSTQAAEATDRAIVQRLHRHPPTTSEAQ
jgi:hypothetical protein